MFHHRLRALVLVLAAASSLSCGGTAPGGRPLTSPPDYGPPFAKVGVLEGTAPVRGAMAEGKAGDWLLQNERLRVVVSALDHVDGFAMSGGNIIDAAPAGGEDLLREVFTYFDDTFPRQALYDSVAPDPSDTLGATLVARGVDSRDPALRVETRYALRPGADYLEITTTLENTGADTLREFELGDAIEWGKAEAFAPGPGRDLVGTHGEIPFLLGSARGTAYAWVNPGGSLRGPHGRAWSDPITATADFLPGGGAAYTCRLVIVPGSAASAAASAWRERGIGTAPLLVTVRGAKGGGVPGASVEVEDAGGDPTAWGETGGDGTVAFRIPPGAYHLEARHPERGEAEPREVTVGSGDPTASATLTLPEPGELSLSAVDGEGKPSPARWTFERLGEGAPPDFGPPDAMPGSGDDLFTPTGRGKFRVPPGRYRVTATRGMLYRAWSRSIEVSSGGSRSLDADLPRLDVPGAWVSADLHVHADPSFDCDVSLADRARSLACEGVDWFAGTDHYRRADYAPVLDTLELAAPLHSMVGEEVTTAHLGHFGAFPLPYRADLPRGGGMRTLGMSVDDVFAAIQGEGEDVLIQVNHPRAGANGYFDLLGFDNPGSAAANNLRLDFSLLEVMNGKENPKLDQVWQDWMELLLEGYRVVGVGNSDSHWISEQEVGYPRNLVRLPPGADPGDRDAFLAALTRGDVVATNGPFVEFTLEGAAVGDTLSHAAGTLKGRVRVLAPEWVDVRRLEVWVNGTEDATYMLRGRDDPLRFDEEIEVPIRESSFVVVRVEGDGSLAPVLSPGGTPAKPVAVKPFAFTNPVWVDVPSGSRR